MKSILVFFYLLIYTLLYSQPIYTSKVYNMINGNEYGTEVMVTNDGYLQLTNGICDPGTGISKACIALNLIGNSGKIIKNNFFKNRFRFCGSSTLQTNVDTICIFGYNEFTIPWEWKIYKFSFENDSIGIIFPEHSSSQRNTHALAFAYQKDHYYLAGGFADNFNIIRELIVVKTDINGKAIKEERFHDIATPNVFNISHAILDLQQTADSNFIISTYTGQHSFHQPSLVKFDKDLNIIWQRSFSRNNNANNRPDITSTPDSGLVMSWGIYGRDLVDSTGNEEYYKYGFYPPTVHKIDKAGNLVWSDTLWTLRPTPTDEAPLNNISMLTTARNGDIIGVGTYEDVILRHTWGWIFRYNKDGKKLWEKIYQDSNINSKYSDFLDVAEAENGDIVSTGQIEEDDAWGGNAGYTWLLRVDSLGCFEPNCGILDTLQLVYITSDLISGVDEVVGNERFDALLSISPNPASQTTKIYVTSDNFEYGKIRICDINSNLIKTMDIDSKSAVDVDVSGFVPGVYVVEYVSLVSGWRDVAKIIIIE
jgi:hypothetical protein